MLGIFFLQTAHSMIIHQELLVEPEVIVPEDTIYLPQVYREIDLTCSGQEDLPDGGRFSSPGWTEEFVYANNLNCSWTLGRRGCTTEVDFYEIDIEDLHLLRKCPYDKLTISTGDQQLNRELCGRSPQKYSAFLALLVSNFHQTRRENDVEYEAIILESSGIGSGDGSGEEIQIDVLDLVNEESVFLEYNPFDYMSDFPIRSDQNQMKLRSRSIVTNDPKSTPKRARTQHQPNEFEKIFPDKVTSYGQFGKCEGSECDGVPAETIQISKGRFCEICVEKERGEEQVEGRKFDKSDAKFRCPAFSATESCKSENLSFQEFYLGSCCEPGSKWLTDNEKAQRKKLIIIKNIHAEAKREQTKLEAESKQQKWTVQRMEKLQSKKKQMANTLSECYQKILEEIEEIAPKIEDARKTHEGSTKRLLEKEKEVDMVAKRYKQLSYEYHAVEVKEKSAKEKMKGNGRCKVCLEEYSNNSLHHKCALRKCGHVSCKECLERILTESYNDYALCPHCRKSFTGFDLVRINE
ncbi:Oidioi.mRNA.OKI2018_I69.XSR.g13567.t1.cds [Oikopleura dioica]|uniref:Oidioi.mRNA.OKI2018_I69.XSR.g13567.t1.cds n=1 Tax=Oikopleura dioica TaxID=34765 RepID=A0ABN7SDD4_OIKDI|nr:Oidioi.mRNA.OKI2018_I69.XSR.g13567.t1.cds [Oikopleura dioica]